MKIHSFQHYSHGLEMAVHDAWITAKVKSALAFSDPTLSLHINVKTHAGIVGLSGRVNTHRQCEQAMGLARSVHGVAEVDASDLQTHVFTLQKRPTPKRALSAGHNRQQRWTTNDNGYFVGAALQVGSRGRREAGFLCAPE
jgi:hyperosmotically inducible protein